MSAIDHRGRKDRSRQMCYETIAVIWREMLVAWSMAVAVVSCSPFRMCFQSDRSGICGQISYEMGESFQDFVNTGKDCLQQVQE